MTSWPPRRGAWALGTAGTVLVIVAALTLPALGDDGESAASSRPAVHTAPVERRDLVERESVDGTLGYGDTHDVSTSRQGTVTWRAADGTTVARGQPLFEIDEVPVVLFYGDVPIYRTLASGVDDGRDVRVLEENLVALGFGDGLTVDEHFNGATAAAVRRWQKSAGLEETGQVEPGDVIVQPNAVRVASAQADVGASVGPGAPVLHVTGTARVVTARLDAGRQTLAKPGDKAQVELPDGSLVDATVFAVGSTATVEGQETSPKVKLVLLLDDQHAGAGLDQAPVTVDLTKETAKHVLTVPVRALLARGGGRYAVEVVRGTQRQMVPVRLGAFANGYVEVTGGLRAGDEVVVAE